MKVNQSGFSLVTVMAVLGTLVSAGYYFMTEEQTNSKLRAKEKVNLMVDSAAQTAKILLSSIANCNATIVAPLIPVGGSIPALIQASDGSPVLTAPQVFEGYHILEMKLVEESVKTAGGPVLQDFFVIVFDVDPRKANNMFGSATIGRKFRINGTKVGSQYIKCWHDEDGILENALAASCAQLSGNWDPIAFTCTGILETLIDPTPVLCSPPLQYRFIMDAGKIKVSCI